jgi:hypothetical protein
MRSNGAWIGWSKHHRSSVNKKSQRFPFKIPYGHRDAAIIGPVARRRRSWTSCASARSPGKRRAACSAYPSVAVMSSASRLKLVSANRVSRSFGCLASDSFRTLIASPRRGRMQCDRVDLSEIRTCARAGPAPHRRTSGSATTIAGMRRPIVMRLQAPDRRTTPRC